MIRAHTTEPRSAAWSRYTLPRNGIPDMESTRATWLRWPLMFAWVLLWHAAILPLTWFGRRESGELGQMLSILASGVGLVGYWLGFGVIAAWTVPQRDRREGLELLLGALVVGILDDLLLHVAGAGSGGASLLTAVAAAAGSSLARAAVYGASMAAGARVGRAARACRCLPAVAATALAGLVLAAATGLACGLFA